MPQRKCLNCGKYGVYRTAVHYRNRDTNAAISTHYSITAFWGVLTWIAATLLLIGVVPYLFGIDNMITKFVSPFTPVVLGIAVGLYAAWEQKRRLASSIRVHDFRCGECNHTWNSRSEEL